ncbi:hypothetical protein Btru_038916 [Bulinus truncatus]|nr:hypothetical protein Btru_038916 [Bulinus truncatus]
MKQTTEVMPLNSHSILSHCERYWYGHRLLDRCYKPLTIAVTEREAREQCLRQGATLAAAETDFYGNIIGVLHDMFVAERMAGKRIWLDTSLNFNMASGNGLCSSLENGQILRTSCISRLSFICQKDAQIVRTAEDFREKLEAMTYIQNMTSFQPQTLPCPLGMTAFDDVINWYKDGRPIDDATDEDVTPFGPKNGQLPNSLELDLSILRRVGETNPAFLKPAMLQGEYWCQIWRKEPFRQVSSNKIYLKFTDVITLRGVIFTEPISYTDAAIFNRLGQRVGVPGAMELRLTNMNRNIKEFLQRIHPIVRDVITFIKYVSANDGRSEFLTYICTSTGDLAPNFRGDVTHSYLSAFFEALVRNEDVIRSEWNLTLPLIRAVSISMTDLCPEKKLVDKNTNFVAMFPRTPVNTQVYSLDYCDGAHAGVAYCKGNLQTAAYWDSVSITQSCLLLGPSPPVPGSAINGKQYNNGSVSTLTTSSAATNSTKATNVIPDIKTDLLDNDEGIRGPPTTTNALNVSQVSDLLSQMLNQTSNLTHSDIHTLAHLVNNLASDNKMSAREVGELLIQTVNKVLDSPPEVLMKAEEESHAPSK